MSMKTLAAAVSVLSLSLIAAACARGEDEPTRTRPAAASADTATSAEVEHGAHASTTDSTPKPPSSDHAGHDISPPDATTAGAGQHSQHGAVRTAVRGADEHGAHGAVAQQRPSISSAAHGEHAAPAPSRGPLQAIPPSEATAKLHRLISLLLGDTAIHNAILTDTALARLWQDSTVRNALRARESTHH